MDRVEVEVSLARLSNFHLPRAFSFLCDYLLQQIVGLNVSKMSQMQSVLVITSVLSRVLPGHSATPRASLSLLAAGSSWSHRDSLDVPILAEARHSSEHSGQYNGTLAYQNANQVSKS